MTILEKYKKYRQIQVELHGKILDRCVSADDFNKSTEIIGVVQNHTIVLESNEEKDAILDFNIYSRIKNGKSSVIQYAEQVAETNEFEEKLLTAMKTSDISLYEVVEIEKEKGIVDLKDVLNNTDIVKVIDIGLSESTNSNILIFTRLLHLDGFSMTSGLGFVFSKNHKQYLINRSRKLAKKINSGDPLADRFIAFFKLNRSDGLPIILEKV
jgi:hypothetical protein